MIRIGATQRIFLAILSSLLIASTATFARKSIATPVAKVIELLDKLDKQITEEGAKEAAEYDKFACFCKEQADAKLYAIEKSTEKITALGAEIDRLTGEISSLDADVITLGERVTAIEGEVDAVKETRSQEYDAYVVANANVTEAIAAVQAAIKAIRESKIQLVGNAKLDGKLALAQVQQVAALVVASLPGALKPEGQQARVLASFLGDKPHAYNFQSNDIIATLQWLERSFKENKNALHLEEHTAATAFDLHVLALENEKKFKQKRKTEKEELSAEKGEDKHAHQKDKSEEESDKQSDTEFQTELTAQCKTKAEEWDSRSQSRAAELTAINEAVGILKSGVSKTYSANKKLVGLTAKSTGIRARESRVAVVSPRSNRRSSPQRVVVSFLQRGAEEHSQRAIMQQLLALLSNSASRLGSSELAALRSKVQLQEDHFVKVRGIINDLIARLEAQATSEAEAKSFCDTEMTKAIGNRDSESLNIESELATISSKESEKKQLMQEIAALSAEIAGLNKGLREATELRNAEKVDNEKTIADAAAGKLAVQQAIEVLEAFYGDATFVQIGYKPPNSDREDKTVGDLAPETSFSGDYGGKQEAAKGIIGLLNVIFSDFERTGTTVDGQEQEAQSQFVGYESTAKSSIEAKEGSVTNKNGEVEDVDGAIVTAKSALMTAKGLKESALKELEKLKAMCVEGEESAAERKAKRQQEIEALKEALKILQEWK